ncbi:MAG: Gldg family protein, partial [Waterburya sp.]
MTKIILFFLGISLCVAGIVAASIIENWSAMPIILLISGVFLLLSGLWLWGNKYKFWQLRSTKQGAGAIAKITAVLIIIAMLNWVGIRYGKRWDFTENKLYTLSQQSQVMVAKLEQPLEVLVFNRNNNSELENLLQNYRRYSDQFQFKFIDPEQQIGLAQQFGVQSLGEVYLQYGDKRQKLDTVNAALGETLSETRLTNGIEKIKRDRSINIYFLQGHGEAPLDLVEGGLAQAVKNLEDKGNT